MSEDPTPHTNGTAPDGGLTEEEAHLRAMARLAAACATGLPLRYFLPPVPPTEEPAP